jgi:serine/threonine-protein kinase
MPEPDRPPLPSLSSISSTGVTSGALSNRLSHAVTAFDTMEELDKPKLCPTCQVRYPADFKVCPRDATELAESTPREGDDELVGKTLGQTYTIVRVLGEGGMGRVYEATHKRISGKRFAIKMLHPEYSRQPEVISRFQREAEAAASIHSPYVVDVYDVDRTADGRPFIVGEFLDGQEFAAYLEKVGKMPVGPAVRIVRQICKALDSAHGKGVVHRDMKPENVFLTGDLARPIAKVIDFGISKTGDTPGTALTKTGMIMGTPSYMAPEQARGERVDHRADIYAVGAILYCALTGKRPFDRGDPTATLTAVLTEDPPRPRSIEPSIPDPLELIIQRAMAKSPADRYPSMADLDGALAPYDTEVDLMPAGSQESDGPTGTRLTITRMGTATSLERQAREVSMARPLIMLLSALGLFWVVGSLVTMIGAIVRMARGPGQNLTGSEAVLLSAGILFTLITPILLGVRHLRRTVWDNSVKALDLCDRLKYPVVVGLVAYGLGSLLVRFIEIVVLRRAVGVAWPAWDILLMLIGGGASLAAFKMNEADRKRS